MTIDQLIAMAERRKAYLLEMRAAAERVGDVTAVSDLDAKILETELTLNQLSSLSQD